VFALAKAGADISAPRLFAAIVAFDQLRFPLLFYPMSLAHLAQAKVSAARVEAFLGLKEISEFKNVGNARYNRDEDMPNHGEIILKNVEVYWSDPLVPLGDTTINGSDDSPRDLNDSEKEVLVHPKPVLQNINLHVSNGELCAVVGRVGSGKSTLCSAIINEAILKEGEIILKGKVAYAAQTPWILNATLRDNILFGLPMDEDKYHKVLRACQLEHDLNMMENGDLTDIGERGINLSGGQKARVSIARAAYSDADTIILDDPLSALDPEVGKKLFSECICNLLDGKTRLLVTNQIQFLSSCDSVVALREGKITEQGSFSDLVSDKGSEVNRLLASSRTGSLRGSDTGNSSSITKDKKDTVAAAPANKDQSLFKKSLHTKEERNVGAVSMSVYLKYLKAGGGYIKFGFVYFSFVSTTVNQVAITSWISYWTSDADYERHPEAFYLGMHFMLAVTLGIFSFVRAYLLAKFGVNASESLHKNLLGSILRAPQSFFDTTPMGRILSRFSKDIYAVDLELSDFFDWFLYCTTSVAASIGIIMFVTPWFGIATIPLGLFYFKILNSFREVSRETKRLDSISRSPVYAHFSETLGGLITIRAYRQPDRFRDEFEEKVNSNTKAYYNLKAADRWLSIRLEFIGSAIAGCAAAFATNLAISTSGEPSDSHFSSLAGLSLTFAITIAGTLNWIVRSFAQFEAAMNSCERILYYTENIPQEAPSTSDELELQTKHDKPSALTPSKFAVITSDGKALRVSSDWPKEGRIVLDNLRMRYRSDTPLVLRGLNVSIAPGERIGVVGRTGSGKSSLLLTLLRLVEPHLDDNDQSYRAPISIDGVDILRIGLRDLRLKVGIIPQNPVLFSGSIRSNIDPFSQYKDNEIWNALDKCGMKVSVERMPLQLEAAVTEHGQNLSSGMRQMLVLGRALLRQCRILLLDEATSSVDFETDQEIQRTLREAFSGCTVLTIAHRINTIMDSDKIMVMKDGIVEEFAPPQELLKVDGSVFSEIVRHAEEEENE